MSVQPGIDRIARWIAVRAALVFVTVLTACPALWAQESRGEPDFMLSPETRDEFFAELLAEKWIGRTVDELIATWGAAKKIEGHRDGSQLLLYKMQFVEGFQLTPAHYVALSSFGPSPVAGVYFAIPGQLVPKIVGRLKARFHVDANGEIVDVEVLSLKWTRGKQRHEDDELVEEPTEPGKPFKADVEVHPPS